MPSPRDPSLKPTWTSVTPAQFCHWVARFSPPLRKEVSPGGPNQVVYWHGDDIVASYDLDADTGHTVRTDLMPLLTTVA